MNYKQLQLFELPPQIKTIHDPYWDELETQAPPSPIPYRSVREQATLDTEKVAPEHIHWLEEYWVERSSKKYYYWRYCWMEGRKIRRCHIGSVRSLKALGKYQAVEEAIALGQAPQKIKQLIKC